MAKVNPKTKTELDELSYDQIQDHRVAYCRQTTVIENDARRYFKELDLYIDTRFKDNVLAQYERWSKSAKEENPVDPLYKESSAFLMEIIDRIGREEFYTMSIENTKKELGEMIYVK